MTRLCVLVLVCLSHALVCVTALTRGRRSLPPNLRVRATPRVIVDGISDELRLDCRQPASLDDVMWAVLLQMELVGENETTKVAQQRAKTEVFNNRTKAVGHSQISESDETSYLTVTIQDPSLIDIGEYRCRFIYLDLKNEVKVITGRANVTFSDVPVEEYTPTFESSCDCEGIWDEIDDIRAALAVKQKQSPAQAAPKDGACTAAFSAKFSTRYAIQSNTVAIFDTITTNSGSAYDMSTGEFTAPCDGQYFFSLTLRSWQNMDSGYVEGVIQRAGKPEATTSVFLDAPVNNYQSATNGVVLTLAQGETVSVLIKTTSSGDLLDANYSVFSGFYLSA